MTPVYACGVDPSGGGADQFAWAIAHRDGDRIVVDLVRGMGGGRQRLDVKGAVAACAEDCRRYRVGRVTGDRYAGDWPAAEFRAAGLLYEASPKDKAALYLETLPLWTAGRIEIPDDRELVRQAKLLERTGAGRGRDRVDHPRGGHDDKINAVVLAIAALGAPRDWSVTTAAMREEARRLAWAGTREGQIMREVQMEERLHRMEVRARLWAADHDY